MSRFHRSLGNGERLIHHVMLTGALKPYEIGVGPPLRCDGVLLDRPTV